jgi:hypothetical protein
MTINSYKFGLNDVKIAVWNSTENYGTAVDVESVQMYGIEFQTENGTLEGDDIITDTHAKMQSANITLRFGFKDLAVLEVLTGITNTESPYNESMIFGRDNMPYFAICGRADATSGGGDSQVFLPKVKLMEGLNVSMEKGSYVIEDITAMAIYEGTTYGMGKLINNNTATTVTIPPTGASS